MKEENDVPHAEDESQAVPEPTGAPVPVEANDPLLRSIGITGVLLVAGGAILLPLSVATSSTQGAMRSSKIRWEERQAEVRQAADAQQLTHDEQSHGDSDRK